jgi:hypothetical protein
VLHRNVLCYITTTTGLRPRLRRPCNTTPCNTTKLLTLGTASANEKLGTALAIAAEKFFLFF